MEWRQPQRDLLVPQLTDLKGCAGNSGEEGRSGFEQLHSNAAQLNTQWASLLRHPAWASSELSACSSQPPTKISSSNSESWWEFAFLATIIVVIILLYFLLSVKHVWKDYIIVLENLEAQICSISNMFARQTVCITEKWLFWWKIYEQKIVF